MKTKKRNLILALALAAWSSSNAAQVIDLGSVGDLGSTAYAINNSRVMVGWKTEAGATVDRPFMYFDGAITPLVDSPGRAYAINDAGQAVGYYTVGQENHAFLYQNGILTDIGTKGSPHTAAWAINALGEVVGLTYVRPAGCGVGTCDFTAHAFSWKDGVMTDLNDLLPQGSGWVLSYAFGVNIRGEIVGQGQFNGTPHAYFFQP